MRAYLSETVAIQRGTETNQTGTLDPTVSYATLTGLSAVEAVVQHMSSAQAIKTLGRVSSETYTLTIDNDLVPAGQNIREQDRVVIAAGEYAATYTIKEARLIQGRVWNCNMEKKLA